jgi:hypothetical protein
MITHKKAAEVIEKTVFMGRTSVKRGIPVS